MHFKEAFSSTLNKSNAAVYILDQKQQHSFAFIILDHILSSKNRSAYEGSFLNPVNNRELKYGSCLLLPKRQTIQQ